MKRFMHYVGDTVRREHPDIPLARSTWNAAIGRVGYAERTLKSDEPKYAVENAFEAIREAIDAILFANGYKSYSHEASVQYLDELGFTPKEIVEVDNLRRQRNAIKYYGDDAIREEAENALTVAKRTIARLEKHAKGLKITNQS